MPDNTDSAQPDTTQVQDIAKTGTASQQDIGERVPAYAGIIPSSSRWSKPERRGNEKGEGLRMAKVSGAIGPDDTAQGQHEQAVKDMFVLAMVDTLSMELPGFNSRHFIEGSVWRMIS